MAGKRQNKSNGNIVFLKYTIIFYVIMIFIAESSINIIKFLKKTQCVDFTGKHNYFTKIDYIADLKTVRAFSAIIFRNI